MELYNQKKPKKYDMDMIHVKHIRKAYIKEPFKDPITSYGIILFYISKPEQKIYYYLCQRRDSIEYSVILRGQYQKEQLKLYVQLISKEEQHRLMTYDFDILWDDLWVDRDNIFYKQLYHSAKQKFDANIESIRSYIHEYPSDIETPPWGFAKGRINQKETQIECALREFQEETNLKINYKNVIINEPFTETYTGSNHKIYRTIYYLAKAPRKYVVKLHKIKNKNKIREKTVSNEISNCTWIDIDDAKHYLSSWRQDLLYNINENLCRKYKLK